MQGCGGGTTSRRGEDCEGSRRGSAGEIRGGEEDCRGRKEAKEGEEWRQAEEQRQAAIALAEYQRNAEKAEADRAEAEKIEAAKATFKKHEDVDVTFRKATAKVQWELKVKARKEARGWGSGVARSGRFP